MSKITKSELSGFHLRLTNYIEDLQSQGEATTADRAPVVLDQQSVGRLSRMDALQQQAMANATHQLRELEVRRSKSALLRIEEGEFGYCTDCGEEISKKRLQHNPSIPLCFDCATTK